MSNELDYLWENYKKATWNTMSVQSDTIQLLNKKERR
jgi:hypothetical protein